MTKRLALALGLRDRPDLASQSIKPLIHDDIDLWLIDGSGTEKGRMWAEDAACIHDVHVEVNVTGGADRAICHALQTLLDNTESPYVGWIENDVLLHPGWLGPCLALFDRGQSDGLVCGAVSARAYEDRVLCQRDGYALVHNLGAGHIILTRDAARLVLKHVRNHWTTQNRKVFHALSGLDIGRWWCFRGSQHFTTVDWGFDAILASHGLASLALTPSPVEMIGQSPPLADQGLKLVTEPVELLRDNGAFARFVATSADIRSGGLRLPDPLFVRLDDNSQIVFAHQIGVLGGWLSGAWRQKWQQGFGPFAYVAVRPEENQQAPHGEIPVAGPASFFVSGGKEGGRVQVVDTQSGYDTGEVELPPEGDTGQTMQLWVPGSVAWRAIRLTALTPGITFYGIKVSEPQPVDPTWSFDVNSLPPPL